MRLNIGAVIYNVTISAGVVLIGTGSASRWGWPIGALCTGALLIALSLFSTWLLRSSRNT